MMNEVIADTDHIGTVAILAPTPSDAKICYEILTQNQIQACICGQFSELCGAISNGVGVGLVPEASLDDENFQMLRDVLHRQPSWSDFPLLILQNKNELSSQRVEQLLSLGSVTLVACPLRISVFISTLQARLRDRRRQIEVKNLLQEQQRAAEAAAIDSRRLHMALQAGQMGAWEWSEVEMYWSPQFYELFGFDPDTVPHPDRCFERVHEEDREELRKRWASSISDGVELAMEFRTSHPQLGERWLSAMGEPFRGWTGKTLRHSGVIWDITEYRQAEANLKKAQQQAEAASRSKSEFIANMSHEIRTPMTAILGYVDLLGDLAASDEARDFVVTIRRNGLYLLEIINDILDLSKIEANKIELYAESFSPIGLIEDVQSIMSVRAAESNIEFNIDYASEVPSLISTDPKRLKQILINLVGNAIKFTDRGKVTLSTRYDEASNRFHFEVRDTGIGMSKSQISQLFQPFTQVDASESRRFEGTGLGLAISQRLAAMMGGEISVQSEPGVGSCFIASIDCGDIEAGKMVSARQIHSELLDDDRDTNLQLNCRVLVVDDRRDIRFLATRLLSKAGAEITEAEDGQHAVEIVQEILANHHPLDLILLDMQMPRLDGYRTAEQLRRLGYSGPIIALTADAMQGDMNRCIKCGCNDYLSKPIDQVSLLRMAKRLTSA